MSAFEVEKVEGSEQPIPIGWRLTLKAIADAFVAAQIPSGAGIRPVTAETAKISFGNIDDYPDPTGPLTDVSWDSSVCAWMGDYWEVLVDLITVSGERSDLVLHARVFEVDGGTEIEPGLIYVP